MTRRKGSNPILVVMMVEVTSKTEPTGRNVARGKRDARSGALQAGGGHLPLPIQADASLGFSSLQWSCSTEELWRGLKNHGDSFQFLSGNGL